MLKFQMTSGKLAQLIEALEIDEAEFDGRPLEELGDIVRERVDRVLGQVNQHVVMVG
jgi:hypothetical protein